MVSGMNFYDGGRLAFRAMVAVGTDVVVGFS